MQRPNVHWWKDVISRLCLVPSLRRGQETPKKVWSSKRTLLYNDVCTYLKNLFILSLIIFYFFPFKYWVLVPLYGCGRWWCPVDVRVGILLHRAGIQDGCSRYRDNGVSRLPLSGVGINSLAHSIWKSPPPPPTPPPKKIKNYAFNSNIIIHTLIVLTWRNCLKIKSFYTFWTQLSSRNMRDMIHCRVVCLSIFYYVSNSRL